MKRLSIVCVTRYEDHAEPFLKKLLQLAQWIPDCEVVLGADGADAYDVLQDWPSYAHEEGVDVVVVAVQSQGYIESVLDDVLTACQGDYVLRIDDDERVSPALAQWLRDGQYLTDDHWKFSRAHLWPDLQHYVSTPPLWPDHQTRLSVRAKAGGRTTIHAGSPFGGGRLAPAVLEHHKFIVRSLREREAIAARYDQIARGAGTSSNMKPFQLPDLEHVTVEQYHQGVDIAAAVDDAFEVGVFQHRGELEPFASWLASRRPVRVLEIGTLHGGTAALWHHIASGPVVTVDLPNGRFGAADHGYDLERSTRRMMWLKERYPRITSILGNSHDQMTQSLVADAFQHQSIDLLFIDGDHTYEGVKRDLEMYRPMVRPGGIIALHDVLDTPKHRKDGCFVHKLWAELPPHKAVFTIGGPWGGIGVTFA